MKKSIFYFLFIVCNYSINVNASNNSVNSVVVQQFEPDVVIYDNNPIVVVEDEWRIIKSPLDYASINIFLKGDNNSEEVVIDIEKSLTSTNFLHTKLYNGFKKFLSKYIKSKYRIEYCDLFVMLSIAGQCEYDSIMIDPNLVYSEWLMNFDYFNFHTTPENCIKKFKEKFPKCNRIRLKPFSLDQKNVLENSSDMNKFIKLLKNENLEILLENEIVDV
ncbi:MAG: hypothetical protein Q8L85_06350 [Alphaproteobacteria bacterium]|nr:hypothetical protein [Alphaproteobacteria bacterium]